MNARALLFVLSIVFAFNINTASAIETLNYQQNISLSLQRQITKFLKSEYNIDLALYDIAGVDLNNDGIDEYILKSNKCAYNGDQCLFLIIAEKKEGFILLSRIKSKNILIAKTLSHGVKDMLIFKNQINDYDFDIYIWSPEQKSYIMKSVGLKNQD